MYMYMYLYLYLYLYLFTFDTIRDILLTCITCLNKAIRVNTRHIL